MFETLTDSQTIQTRKSKELERSLEVMLKYEKTFEELKKNTEKFTHKILLENDYHRDKIKTMIGNLQEYLDVRIQETN